MFSPDRAVVLVSAVVRPATDPGAALAAAAGQTLSFVRPRTGGGADTVRASVVRSDPPQYRLSDGRYLLSSPGEPLVPAELVRTTPETSLDEREAADLASKLLAPLVGVQPILVDFASMQPFELLD